MLAQESRGQKSELPRELGDCLSETGQDSAKLPSLWSDTGRMSWLGANLDLFDWGRLREVPEQVGENILQKSRNKNTRFELQMAGKLEIL